jgi:hypothetical protein
MQQGGLEGTSERTNKVQSYACVRTAASQKKSADDCYSGYDPWNECGSGVLADVKRNLKATYDLQFLDPEALCGGETCRNGS